MRREFKSLKEVYNPPKGMTPPVRVPRKAKYAKAQYGANYCEQHCPCCGEYICTRPTGHTGEHEAHGWQGEACPIPTWGTYVPEPILGAKYAQEAPYCSAWDPEGIWQCTRKIGHTGEHEAHSMGKPCRAPWTAEPNDIVEVESEDELEYAADPEVDG